ncbi:MAG: antitoxin family protein [Thermoguttaceae bacterium]
MTHIDAIYEHGVFRPLAPVDLAENQRVALSVEAVERPRREDALAWLEETDRLRNELAAKYGIMPDSTLDIAEDRKR